MTGPALYGSILNLAAAEQLASLRTVVVGGEQLAGRWQQVMPSDRAAGRVA